MAGIDLFDLYPGSKMAVAARLGLSRFQSNEGVEIPATLNPVATVANVSDGSEDVVLIGGASGSAQAGVFTLNTAGVKNTATLLAAAGLVSSFSTLSIAVITSAAGITIARGAGSAVYSQGAAVSFTNVSVANNSVTLTLAAGDVVVVLYSGI
jgi:hypothetical protein